MATTQDLLSIDFNEIGEWALSEGVISYFFYNPNDGRMNCDNILYAFTEYRLNDVDGTVRYIGKTTKKLSQRFVGYKNPGNSQATNQRVSAKIKKAIESGSKVGILVFTDVSPLLWGGYNLNVAAGIEDSLIQKLQPEWNKAGVFKSLLNPLEEYEDSELKSLGGDLQNVIQETPVESGRVEGDLLCKFQIKLGNTYLNSNQGFMNPGVGCDKFLGRHGENATILFGGNTATAKINRTANTNGSVRFVWGPLLGEWYRANYQLNDVIEAKIYSGNIVVISTD